MLIVHVSIITNCFIIRITATGLFLRGLKFPHLKSGLFNYSWIRHRSVYCGAASKARFLSYLVEASSGMVNQARAQSPELVISALQSVRAPA